MRGPPKFVALSLLLVCCLVHTSARAQSGGGTQKRGLTVDLVVSLLNAGAPAERVVELIQQTPSDFNLTLQSIDNLRKAGVPSSVLDAMLKARINQTRPVFNWANRKSPESGGEPNAGQTETGFMGSDGRLQEAKKFVFPETKPPEKEPDLGCANEVTVKYGNRKFHEVDLDYDTGSSSASRLGSTGLYCFALRHANALYDWVITLNVSEPTGNPFDLLNDAIQTLGKLATGASSAQTKALSVQTGTPPPCDRLTTALTDVTQKATTLKQLLAAVVPGKDSSGKVAYIPVAATQKNWQPVDGAFREFDTAVRNLQKALNETGCTDPDLLKQAEDIILDDYPKVQKDYVDVATKLSRKDVQYLVRSLEGTASADLVATPSYAATANGSKTFHFDPSFGILSSSAGFLLTQLPARSYASATAPDPNDLTKTQNVLRVDYGAGVRPALVVLLTANVPQVNRRNFGLGFSAGPVFDVANGKADTSHFGFFVGPSFRLTPWVFLTPGFHFGEFADFPQGFTRAGQVIPANTGTPIPTKRFTGRFAFAVTFKIKDLGAAVGQQTKATPQSPPAGKAQP